MIIKDVVMSLNFLKSKEKEYEMFLLMEVLKSDSDVKIIEKYKTAIKQVREFKKQLLDTDLSNLNIKELEMLLLKIKYESII